MFNVIILFYQSNNHIKFFIVISIVPITLYLSPEIYSWRLDSGNRILIANELVQEAIHIGNNPDSTSEQWLQAVNNWKQAIQYLEKVSPNQPKNYDIAQKRIKDYTNQLGWASKSLAISEIKSPNIILDKRIVIILILIVANIILFYRRRSKRYTFS